MRVGWQRSHLLGLVIQRTGHCTLTIGVCDCPDFKLWRDPVCRLSLGLAATYLSSTTVSWALLILSWISWISCSQVLLCLQKYVRAGSAWSVCVERLRCGKAWLYAQHPRLYFLWKYLLCEILHTHGLCHPWFWHWQNRQHPFSLWMYAGLVMY
jgi:hypothetical protein